jgi:hypothetical protein
LEEDVADVNWTGNHAEDFAVMKNLVANHEAVLHGNGQPGILDFISGLKGQMRLILILLSSMVGIAAILTAILTIHEARIGDIKIPHFFFALEEQPAYARDSAVAEKIPPSR